MFSLIFFIFDEKFCVNIEIHSKMMKIAVDENRKTALIEQADGIIAEKTALIADNKAVEQK